MLNRNSLFNKKNMWKRILSMIMAVTIIMAEVNFGCLSGLFDFNFIRTVFAYDYNSVTKVVTISSSQDLADYSALYYSESGHEEDTIHFTWSNSGVSEPIGYKSIGSDSNPFKGKLLFDTAASSQLNLRVPLFGTIYDSVQIVRYNNSHQEENTSITIIKTAQNDNEPLFANKIIHDSSITSLNNAPGWNIVSAPYNDGTNIWTHDHAGFIEEISDGAMVSIKVQNDSFASPEGSNIKNDDDVGVICGKMGTGAKLKAEYSGTNVDYTIETTGGHAGGFVGSMASGSSFELKIASNPQTNQNAYIKTTCLGDDLNPGKYAGGLVGYNAGGVVTLDCTNTYEIKQMISGAAGEGGLFGYYEVLSGETFMLDVSDYEVDCLLNTSSLNAGTGAAGGLIGVLNNKGTVVIDGTVDDNGTPANTTVSSEVNTLGASLDYKESEFYGGLIGKYQTNALSNKLSIKNIDVSANNTYSTLKYGGCISESSDLAYIEFDKVSVASTGHGGSGVVFGGLINNAESSYIYAKNVSIGSSSAKISSFDGGGLVNNLKNGVLRMSDTINLSNAEPKSAATNGQIVASRDNALIYADAGWTFTRSDIGVDNIGSWGDVIVFNTGSQSNGANLVKSNVLTENANHTITIGSPTASNVIASVEDFAKISILFQTDIGPAATKNRILIGTSLAASTVLSLSSNATIDLRGTGLKGITRDNGSTRINYSGATFAGNYGKVILDVENVGNKPIYYHRFNGLFGKVTGTTFSNLNMDGSISINTKQDSMYAGAIAAQASGNLGLSSCNTASTLIITVDGTKNGFSGRAIGVADTSISNITVSGGTYDGKITGSNSNGDYRLGGVIGYINSTSNSSVSWVFENLIIKGEISNTYSKIQKMGGLVAGIKECNSNEKSLRNLTIDGVTITDLTVSGNVSDKGTMGGLLGFWWAETNVDLQSLTVNGTSNITMTGTGSHNGAGLVQYASGKWDIGTLNFSNIKLDISNAGSFGYIVNKGYTEVKDLPKKGIYLELNPSTYTITLDSGSSIPNSLVYDEICAYSASDATKIMENCQGIISIITTGAPKTEANAENSLTYAAKTPLGKTLKNGNTRYYYNLNAIDDSVASLATDPQKLMRWGLNQYACVNIKPYFPDPYSGTISGNFSMDGYSWYPVSVDSAISVSGTFKFFNSEFEGCEAAKSNTKLSSLSGTQHYMMQNGLFYNVNSNITIGVVVLQGNIGAVNSNGTGALIYGTISGSADNVVKVTSKNGSISLDGIRVHNFSTISNNYAPLLINKSTGYVTLDIYNVSNTNSYTAGQTIATSLIGRLGSSTARFLNVTFSNIKLDGRITAYKPSQISNATTDTYGYHTTKSLFTRATLLEQLSYDSNSSGVYNFSYDEDWGGNQPHNVTYGAELGYISGTPDNTDINQFPEEERQYSGSNYYVAYKLNGSVPFSAPNDTVSTTFRTEFLKYVADVNKTSKKYQLSVNHRSTSLEGCGTYNDPYIIDEGTKLESISRMIRGGSNFHNGDSICIPVDSNGDVAVGATWCNNKSAPDHVRYTYDGTDFKATGHNNLSGADIQSHLAGAYYIIQPKENENSITINSSTDFNGLGYQSGSDNNQYMFRGVIYGNNKTIINQTEYPLIKYANGCVVKDLSVTVNKSFSVTGSQNTFPTANAYGAVIGQIHGGDNIIDKVTVGFGSSKISLDGTYAQLVPTGGYVGVVFKGGLIFRNMGSVAATSKLSASNITTNQTKIAVTDMTATTSTHETTNDKWLYVNPYVGRVINGYAINETTAYHAREANQTLKNGTKHYSITDIGTTSVLSVAGSAITIPDSQAFFIMSVIVNSGMGAKSTAEATSVTNTLGYYENYCTTRHARYSEIGEATSTDYVSYASKDMFWSEATDVQKIGDTPYLIENYTSGSSSDNYLAKALGGKSGWTINLTSGVTYTLPDGYKGIGNIFNNKEDYRLSVSKFNGNGCTIDQNTRYVSYKNGFDNKYMPVQGDGDNDDKNGSRPDLGLGLFNREQTSGTYENFTLTGKVRSDVVDDSTGNHINYTTDVHATYVLSVGMLFGTLANKTTIKNVILNDIDVRGAKYAGGFVGLGPMKSNYDITITQDSTNSNTSSGIVVHGVTGVGGMIGRWYQGKPSIKYNGRNFNINGIYSDANFDSNSYLYGIGGIIGVCRAGGGSKNSSGYLEYAGEGTIENIVIGTTSQSAVVECTVKEKGVNAGGLMGTLNRCSPNISNCTINNLSVKSNGTNSYVGGAVGYVTTFCRVTVGNVKVYTNDTVKATISGNGYCGGILGLSPLQGTTDGTMEFTLKDSSIEGYSISGKIVGGIVGQRNSWRTDIGGSALKYKSEPAGTNHNDGFDMRIENFDLSKCTITGIGSNTIAGGLIGEVKTPIKGYNIHTKDLSITGDTVGYVIGKMDDSDKGLIKLVAFSRQETRSNQTMLATIVGTKTGSFEYGNGGYIVFADYIGADSNHTASTINNANNIATFSAPYVHVNPSTTFEGSTILTSDGVSPVSSVSGGKASAALKGINDDVQANKPNYIKVVDSYNPEDLAEFKSDMQSLYNSYISRQSSIDVEASGKPGAANYHFPVLVLDISNATQSNNYINNYIHLLTNTPTDSVFSNFAVDKAGVYQVVLTRYQYNPDPSVAKFEKMTTGNDSFKINGNKFIMDAANTDTIAENTQFTLLDVQFFDPSDSSKIAYHLYIPVYCRKILEYDFRINLESGTTYDRTASVTDIRPHNEENLLVENIGVPITMEIAYTYKRSLQEWKNALEGGDSLLESYSPRKLKFYNTTYVEPGQTRDSLPTATQMVLVDINRNSKAYYLNSLTNAAFSPLDSNDNSYLNLNEFEASDESNFSPVCFNDLMIVTAEANPEGSFVLVQEGETGTVKVNSGSVLLGKELRLYEDTDGNECARYNVTLAFPEGVTELSERYFLTIYTPDDQSAGKVYHYSVGTKGSLNEGEGQFPSKVTTAVNQESDLFLGEIYSNYVHIDNLSDPEMITADNNTITADLRATIELTPAGISNVRNYLDKADIYQSFLIKLDKFNNNSTPRKSEVGILAENIQVTPSEGEIGYEGAMNEQSFSWSGNSNFIEVKSNVDLAPLIMTNSQNNRVTVIKTKVAMTFDGTEGSTDITDQFYGKPETNERGTYVWAYSNISSTNNQTAYSKTSVSDESSNKIYYTAEDQGATLTYDALTVQGKGQLQQLGINRRDSEEPSISLMKTQGNYNISRCKTAASECNYVKCVVKLSRKQDDASYTSPLVLKDYLSSIEIGGTAITLADGAKECSCILDKSSLEFENDVYSIPIDVTVISGDNFENGADSDGNKRVYSNYKITLEVTMQEDNLTATEARAGTFATDYLIYTNAKIYTDRVTPPSGGGN